VSGLLEGIRVVETGVLLAVDNLGGLLGDAGADVIKVESPQIGDYLRNIGPVMATDWSVAHLASNRNKRSVTIDARTPAGQGLIGRLVATADVFITGNIGDTNRKLGLDYEAVREIKPEIVYCQITGFGSSGPYATIPTHGWMMDALGAGTPPMELDENGMVNPIPGSRPVGGSGVTLGPMYAAFAVAAGLSRRDRFGEGCYIDISCADSVLASKPRWGTSLDRRSTSTIKLQTRSTFSFVASSISSGRSSVW
jgi:crotonobetainyl-CoA:carnitine CoA-transferase CaiB-like acyl-CoA transferase